MNTICKNVCFRIIRGNINKNFKCKRQNLSTIPKPRLDVIKLKHDKKLFTPGPLCTSGSVKEAMLRDLGSRDTEFIGLIKGIRETLLQIAGVSHDDYTAIPLQGSGTYAVEAVLQTMNFLNKSKVLILINGAYGKRMAKICECAQISFDALEFPEDQPVNPDTVEKHLQKTDDYTLVAIVHCETSSGVINPIKEIGELTQRYCSGTSYFIDAMSSFGAVPFMMKDVKAHFVVSSANKCLQGVPGFSFVIADKKPLLECKGNCHSLSLDLVDQYMGLESNGQFRFTPPTHSLLAFNQALQEFLAEGGITGRAKRYKNNNIIMRSGMKELGFRELLNPVHTSYIITSFHYPKHPNFSFKEFYAKLNELDQVIYPGKTTNADCFRIGNIGDLHPSDMKHLLKSVKAVCKSMNLPVPLQN